MTMDRPASAAPARLPWMWLLLLGAGLSLAGYFGPWIDHPAAGLAVLGLDLAEYVKFLPQVRSGEITVARELFYLPLVAVSLALSLGAFARPGRIDEQRPSRRRAAVWGIRLVMLALAAMAALNLLPPAWTPERLIVPEFRLQTVAMTGCLLLAGFSPWLGLLPARFAGLGMAAIAGPAAVIPAYAFWQILPTVEPLYGHPLRPGWGIYLCVLGLVVLAVCGAALSRDRDDQERVVNS